MSQELLSDVRKLNDEEAIWYLREYAYGCHVEGEQIGFWDGLDACKKRAHHDLLISIFVGFSAYLLRRRAKSAI